MLFTSWIRFLVSVYFIIFENVPFLFTLNEEKKHTGCVNIVFTVEYYALFLNSDDDWAIKVLNYSNGYKGVSTKVLSDKITALLEYFP